MSQGILEAFNQYFEMVPALSDDLKNEVYKLRFQVYCKETDFEDPLNHKDGFESDAFDNRSIHYLIRHRHTKSYAATTRLILPDQNNPKKPFPIELHSTIDNLEPLNGVPRNKLAEVSRFCVSKDFKRRKYDKVDSLTGIHEESIKLITEDEKRTFPHITIALIACQIIISEKQDIHYWYAVMEPALLRFLSALGIRFTSIGPITEYHGKRRPSIIKVSDLLDGVLQKNPPLWNMLTNNGQFGLSL